MVGQGVQAWGEACVAALPQDLTPLLALEPFPGVWPVLEATMVSQGCKVCSPY